MKTFTMLREELSDRIKMKYFNHLDKVSVISGEHQGKTGTILSKVSTHGVYKVKLNTGETHHIENQHLQ